MLIWMDIFYISVKYNSNFKTNIFRFLKKFNTYYILHVKIQRLKNKVL